MTAPRRFSIPPAILWKEGLLLEPQHFQELALRHERLLFRQLSALSPFPWGVRLLEAEIDPERLRVLRIEAVLPDGLLVEAGGGLDLDLLPWHEELARGPLTVEIAVGPAGFSVDRPRYRPVDGVPVPDLLTGRESNPIPRLLPQPFLRVRRPAALPESEDGAAFPLFRLVQREGRPAFADYVPPLLGLAAAPQLGERCAALAARVRHKARILADRARSAAVATRPAELAETRWAVSCLVSALPPFEQLAAGGAHPSAVHLALLALAGSVAALGPDLLPPALPPYDHTEILAAFREVERFVDDVLGGIVESFTPFRFELRGEVFSLLFHDSWRALRLVLGVRARPGVAEDELALWAENCLLGAASRMDDLWRMRVPGVRRRRIQRHGDLVAGPGLVLFTLDGDDEFIVPGEPLELCNPVDPGAVPPAAELVLYVRTRP